MHVIVKSRIKARQRSRQAGMTLIEVLVALILISVGLLGVAALQLTTLKGNQEAYVRSQASVLATYILDRIRANRSGFLNGEYNSVALNATGTSATTSGNDLAMWQAEINRLLPGGSLPAGAADAAGQIQATGGVGTTNIVTVTIRWSERADQALNETAGTRTLQIRTEI